MDLIGHPGVDFQPHRGAEVPLPEETLGAFVTVTLEKLVLIGYLRFIDDFPFDTMPVDVSLLVKGIGLFKGTEQGHELGRFELR